MNSVNIDNIPENYILKLDKLVISREYDEMLGDYAEWIDRPKASKY